MSKVDELFAYLNERGLRIGGMTLGPEATPEAVAEQILESLKDLEQQLELARYPTEIGDI